jgi:hypothetical protein
MHVWCYDRNADARRYGMSGKKQRCSQIFRAVIDPGKKVAMKIDHVRREEYPLL